MALSEKAVQLNPLAHVSKRYYGFSLITFDRFNEAEKVAQHMLKIDSGNIQTLLLISVLKYSHGKQGEAAFYFRKVTILNPSPGYVLLYADALSNIGLGDFSAEILNGTTFEVLGWYYKRNLEYSISQIRIALPRYKKDMTGNFLRGLAETMASDNKDAIQYLKQSGTFCIECTELIFSYLVLGDEQSAIKLLKQRKRRFDSLINDGAKRFIRLGKFVGRSIEAMEIAVLEGKTDEAVQYLKEAVKRGYILETPYIISPIYNKLREHSEWPAILIESNKKAEEQRLIYLDLVEKEKEAVTLTN